MVLSLPVSKDQSLESPPVMVALGPRVSVVPWVDETVSEAVMVIVAVSAAVRPSVWSSASPPPGWSREPPLSVAASSISRRLELSQPLDQRVSVWEPEATTA